MIRRTNRALLGTAVAIFVLAVVEVSLRGLSFVSSGYRARVEAHLTRSENVRTDHLADSVLKNLGRRALFYQNDETIFHVRPNEGSGSVFGMEEINHLGYRGLDWPESLPQEKKRIAIFGDSCSFGWGITRYAETYAGILARELGADFQVYNFGQPGHSSTQGRALFESWYSKIQPDIVILYFGWNDIWTTKFLTDAELLRILRWTNNPVVRLLRRTFIFGSLQILLDPLTKQTGPETSKVDMQEKRTRVELEESAANLLYMTNAAQLGGTQVIVIDPPFVKDAPLRDLSEDPSLVRIKIDRWRQRIRSELADDLTIFSFVDMDSRDSFGPDGFHPNEAGSRRMAEQLLAEIRARMTTATGE